MCLATAHFVLHIFFIPLLLLWLFVCCLDRMYVVRENMENIQNMKKSGKKEKKIAQVREKSGKFIFSQSELL